MEESIAFETSLPIEEIEKNFDGFNVFDGIMESLRELIEQMEEGD